MADDIPGLITHDQLVDVTTTGRKSGEARRIEIRLHALDGRLYITGRPGRPRSWYANMVATPAFTLHLKQALVRDVPATASPVTAEDDRRSVFAMMLARESRMAHVDVEEWTAKAPLVEVVPV